MIKRIELKDLSKFLNDTIPPKIETKEKSIEDGIVKKLKEKEDIVPMKVVRNADGSFKPNLEPGKPIERKVFIEKNKKNTIIGYKYDSKEEKDEGRRWDIGDLQTKPNFWTERVKKYVKGLVKFSGE